MSQKADDLTKAQPLAGSGKVATRSRRFSDMVERLRPLLKSVAREHAQSVPDCKEDESDIVQRSFLKAVEHIDQFEGETTGQWRAWLVTIVRNQARDVRRYWSQERRSHTQEENNSYIIGSLVDDTVCTPSKVLDDEESRQRLDTALARLSVQDQELVRWRLSNYVTYREIAARLEITETMARRRTKAALLAFREAWTRLEQPGED